MGRRVHRPQRARHIRATPSIGSMGADRLYRQANRLTNQAIEMVSEAETYLTESWQPSTMKRSGLALSHLEKATRAISEAIRALAREG